ncbi:ABC transporter permease [Pseudalkalibacillus hwajinpoensis]|uniref:ABC transporter permease n=1 Tax=Guptibacillus hwajinpoensis TaxID=208199 RepID=UPI001CD6411D|nr:ABC transporter permease [Pseudalkalibacillus hwajinpoensis]MCA0991003.1 ABC transporter permease [Pseudalkalibacillus hwajinpoensis]
MRIIAVVIRILRQFISDKRTMALMIVAPIIILTMLSLVFNGEDLELKLGVRNAPESIVEQMEKHANVKPIASDEPIESTLKNDYDAVIDFGNGAKKLYLEGSDPSINRAVINMVQSSSMGKNQEVDLEVSYLFGSNDMSSFDHFGPVLVGFFIFFFVFLIAGVSFLRERTQGTLERVLATPIKRWELVTGYVIGFGLFTMLQSAIIALYSIYVIDLMMEGAFLYVLLITLMLALSALTLGTLLSSFAKNELQMIQFIPLVVVPQIFFSGLFNLDTISNYLSWIGPLTPLYYGADALRSVMIKGQGLTDIWIDLLVLLGFSIVFMILNIYALKKHRRI